MRDPYSILGVKRDARHEEIKAAWRTKAKTVHPDANRDDPDASARFAEIGQAYDLLKDPKKRDLYDQARRAAERSSAAKPSCSSGKPRARLPSAPRPPKN